MWQDLRFAWRTLWKSRAFAAAAAGMLALGIGANTAVFSVIHGALLRPLPYRDPQRLVDVLDESRRESRLSKLFSSYPDFRQYREHARSFEQLAAATWAVRSPIVSGHGRARGATAIPVSDGFFALLGVRPALGRDFNSSDANGCAVILSYAFWTSFFDASPAAIGSSITLDRQACEVVGVMPAGFSFYPPAAEMWRLMPRDIGAPVFVIGRLRMGVTLAQARAELAALHASLDHPGNPLEQQLTPAISLLQDDFTWLAGRNLRATLWVLLGAVGLVLLIACLNVASLLLGRSLTRGRELAVRAALGGGRARLIRLLLMEGMLLAFAGGGFGVLLAVAAVRWFRAVNPVEMPVGAEIAVSAPALLFTALISLATVLVFALAPAWRSSKVDLHQALKAGGRSVVGGRNRLAAVLVAAEMAFSIALLAGAGLLMESVLRMGRAPLGFEPRGLYSGGISLPVARYDDPAVRLRFFERLAAAVEARGVALGSAAPPFYAGNYALEILGRPFRRETAVHDVSRQSIDLAFLRVLDVPLIRGRAFNAHDRADSTSVALVDETLAREYFPASDPIGQRIRIAADRQDTSWAEIVGVVGTVRRTTVFQEMNWVEAPTVYRPLAQQPPETISVVARTGSVVSLRGILSAAVAELDPEAAVGRLEPVESGIGRVLAYPRFRAVLLSAFAAFALLLAGSGLHAVVSQLAAQRTREIGVRMALGARPSDVVRLIAGQGIRPVLWGLGAGLIAALAGARWISSLLYGVRPRDPLTLAAMSLVLLAVAAAAIVSPARRAARIDPLEALHQE